MTGQIDGRTARRERNRGEVVEAAVALMEEGVVDPSIDQLTERSGLSARSIFRYFEGLDDLRRAVIRRNFEKARTLLDAAPSVDGSLSDRIRRFVDSRLKFNETIAGPARTALLRAHFAPVIADDIREYRKVLDSSAREHFAPELKARTKAETDDIVAVVDVVVSFTGWDRLVTEHRRSRNQVRRAWTLALESVLAG